VCLFAKIFNDQLDVFLVLPKTKIDLLIHLNFFLKLFHSIFLNEKRPSLMLKVKVNGVAREIASGRLIAGLRGAGLKVPSVCYHPDLEHSGGRCRVCVCTVNGRVMTPCNMNAEEGMDIVTDSPELLEDRTAAFSLIPNTHANDAAAPKTFTEELEKRTRNIPHLPGENVHGNSMRELPIDFQELKGKRYVMAHPDKCVHCGLCVRMCSEIQGLGAIADMRKHVSEGEGEDRLKEEHSAEGAEAAGVGTFKNTAPFLTECVSCGQCINVCPYGALEEVQEVDYVERLLKDESVVTVVQIAPAVRVALAEEFGCEPGSRALTREMVAGLRKFSKNTFIYDTNFTADLTIVEEGAELLERLRRALTNTRHFAPHDDNYNCSLPMITSCSPGWVLFAEKNYGELLPHLSTCKSPQQMHGAMTKHYWAEKNGYDRKKIKAISIMPCVAKKAEKDRPEFATDGVPDVDHVLTTREFAKLLKKNGVDPTKIEGEDFDTAFGIASGAGQIFGATGGVMEAALRTAYNIVTGRDVPYSNLAITPVRGMDGVRIRTIPFRDVLPEWKFLEGVDLKVVIAHGLSNARKLMDRIRENKELGLPAEYHFIEVMCCPGGCLGGGGQPKPTNMEIKKKRGQLIYSVAEGMALHRSHDNPRIKEVYADFLGEIGGEKAHHLLHTHYHSRHSAASDMIDPEVAKNFHDQVLVKYPRTNSRLTNIFSDVVDKFGYISDDAVVAIADHVRQTPVHIDSILSHYHFFPRHAISKSMVYLCECPNCRLKGSSDVKEYLKANKIPRETVPWLGWCVNGAPAALVKHMGDPQVHALMNLTPGDPRLKALADVQNPFPKTSYSVLDSHRLYGSTAPSVLALSDDVEKTKNFCATVAKRARELSAEEVIAELKTATLRGCGGAGFPSHIKWTSVMNEKAGPRGKYIVINADEGLPSTFKDYHLLSNPSTCLRMMTGIAIASRATGATKSILYLRYEYKNLVESIMASFKSYRELDQLLDPDFKFEVVLGGGPYVCGEETALFESVEGHLPQARVERSIFPTKQGIFGVPTLVSNVETFSWVTQIIAKGGAAYAAIGDASDQHGVKLLSVCGDLPSPVLGEFPMGISVEKLLREVAGSAFADIAAVEVGGMLEPLLGPSQFQRILSLDNRGDHLSAGGSVVVWSKANFDEQKIYQAKAKFGNTESCQLCVPCREGSAAIRYSVKSMFDDSIFEPNNEHQKKRLRELAVAMEHSSNCGHGKACGKLTHALLDSLQTRHDQHSSFC
jgi:NADP-reducing hydrogenase subunit HndD